MPTYRHKTKGEIVEVIAGTRAHARYDANDNYEILVKDSDSDGSATIERRIETGQEPLPKRDEQKSSGATWDDPKPETPTEDETPSQ